MCSSLNLKQTSAVFLTFITDHNRFLMDPILHLDPFVLDISIEKGSNPTNIQTQPHIYQQRDADESITKFEDTRLKAARHHNRNIQYVPHCGIVDKCIQQLMMNEYIQRVYL